MDAQPVVYAVSLILLALIFLGVMNIKWSMSKRQKDLMLLGVTCNCPEPIPTVADKLYPLPHQPLSTQVSSSTEEKKAEISGFEAGLYRRRDLKMRNKTPRLVTDIPYPVMHSDSGVFHGAFNSMLYMTRGKAKSSIRGFAGSAASNIASPSPTAAAQEVAVPVVVATSEAAPAVKVEGMKSTISGKRSPGERPQVSVSGLTSQPGRYRFVEDKTGVVGIDGAMDIVHVGRKKKV